MVSAIIIKDIKRFWFLYCLALALSAISLCIKEQTYYAFLYLIELAFAALLSIPLIIQSDPARQANCFWRTRAISSLNMLAAKLSSLFLAVIFPLLICTVVMCKALNASSELYVTAVGLEVLTASIYILCCALLASILNSYYNYICTLCAIILLVMIIPWLPTLPEWQIPALTPHDLPLSTDLQLFASKLRLAAFLGKIVCVLGLLAALRLAYRTDTLVTIFFSAAIPLVLGISLPLLAQELFKGTLLSPAVNTKPLEIEAHDLAFSEKQGLTFALERPNIERPTLYWPTSTATIDCLPDDVIEKALVEQHASGIKLNDKKVCNYTVPSCELAAIFSEKQSGPTSIKMEYSLATIQIRIAYELKLYPDSQTTDGDFAAKLINRPYTSEVQETLITNGIYRTIPHLSLSMPWTRQNFDTVEGAFVLVDLERGLAERILKVQSTEEFQVTLLSDHYLRSRSISLRGLGLQVQALLESGSDLKNLHLVRLEPEIQARNPYTIIFNNLPAVKRAAL